MGVDRLSGEAGGMADYLSAFRVAKGGIRRRVVRPCCGHARVVCAYPIGMGGNGWTKVRWGGGMGGMGGFKTGEEVWRSGWYVDVMGSYVVIPEGWWVKLSHIYERSTILFREHHKALMELNTSDQDA